MKQSQLLILSAVFFIGISFIAEGWKALFLGIFGLLSSLLSLHFQSIEFKLEEYERALKFSQFELITHYLENIRLRLEGGKRIWKSTKHKAQ